MLTKTNLQLPAMRTIQPKILYFGMPVVLLTTLRSEFDIFGLSFNANKTLPSFIHATPVVPEPLKVQRMIKRDGI